MSLFVKDERLTSPIQPATRKDRLRADGWEPHEACEDGWQDCGTGTFDHACPDCAYGLVPPEGMVEAAAEGMHAVTEIASDGGQFWLNEARAALITAARWEATDGDRLREAYEDTAQLFDQSGDIAVLRWCVRRLLEAPEQICVPHGDVDCEVCSGEYEGHTIECPTCGGLGAVLAAKLLVDPQEGDG